MPQPPLAPSRLAALALMGVALVLPTVFLDALGSALVFLYLVVGLAAMILAALRFRSRGFLRMLVATLIVTETLMLPGPVIALIWVASTDPAAGDVVAGGAAGLVVSRTVAVAVAIAVYTVLVAGATYLAGAIFESERERRGSERERRRG